MLANVDSDELAAYVVWAPRNGAEKQHVDRVTTLATDGRVTQYWDGREAVATPFDEMLSLTGPCAGIFMLYGPDDRWSGDSPPRPTYYEDAHAREYDREGPQFNGRRFAARAMEMLDSARARR